ncbi:MAG: hypothetical protein ACLUVC_16695 [Longibaculum sp.]
MNELGQLILLGEFEKANLLESTMTDDEVYNCIIEAAIDSESIMFYLFYLNKLIKNENAKDHYFASLILAHPLNFLEGAYDQALYHAKRAIQLDENDISYKEYYLFFYNQLDLIVSVADEEFEKCCDEILKVDENNIAANSVKNRIKS